jgi:tetratricopeptide (TPR) repeat protein/predicted Ser/Thr protein kinase
MAINNWQRIEELFHDASQLQGAARAAFLASQCNGDDAVLQEVNSLLSASETNPDFLEQPSFDLGIQILAQRGSHEGRTIGHYQIIRLLGEGGMGEVYLAEDTKLERPVALKFLMSGLFDDELAKEQLMREARAVAKLAHPHICPVYGVESIGNVDFIVMPYIDGDTLASVMRQQLTLDRLLEISEQIAGALAAAHAHGIIHRDVKPQNVLIAEDGTAKILDFGLAKLVAKAKNPPTFDDRSTASQLGLIPGTVAYMSPEQIRGEKLDCTTDVFSFGIVLHEMLSARNPFLRETREQTLHAIRNEESPALPRKIPAKLRAIAQKCLQKDVGLRYAVAGELLADLKALRAVRARKLANAWRPATKIMLAAALLLIVIGGFIYRAWGRPEHTLAVMSINCVDGIDPDQCRTITQSLRRTFLRRTGVRVAATDNFAGIVGANATTPEKAARELDADLVLFGKVVRGESGPVLKIVVQRARDGQRLFDKPYTVKSDNLALLGQRVTIETALQLQLPTDEDDKNLLDLIAANDNHSPQVYNLYLSGRKKWSLRDGDNLKAAIDDFLQATELDPAYAEAYAGLADCYVLLSTPANGMLAMPTRDAMAKADWAAKQALKYGDHLAESHNAYGSVLWKRDWDWEAAEREFKKAIALDPDYEPAHVNYSIMLSVTGRSLEALTESELAMNQDPFSGAAIMNHCRTLYQARQLQQADTCLNNLAALRPNYGGAKYMHGIVYNALGRIPEATQIFEEIYAKDKAYGGAALGYTYGIAGRRADAERILSEMQQLQKERYLADQELAVIYMGMGDLDNAFPLFQKALEDGFPPSQAIFFSPSFDRLRADPRFPELLKHAKQPVSVPAVAAPSGASLK